MAGKEIGVKLRRTLGSWPVCTDIVISLPDNDGHWYGNNGGGNLSKILHIK